MDLSVETEEQVEFVKAGAREAAFSEITSKLSGLVFQDDQNHFDLIANAWEKWEKLVLMV